MPLFNPTFSTRATQFGIPLFGVAGGPGPFTGNYFWVDPVNGSDGNLGGPNAPLATLTQALTYALAGNNDVIFLTGTYSPTATLTWSKNSTHLIGLDAPVPLASGAAISVASTAATSGAISPLVNVTATGCIFQNVSAISGINQAATQVCWAEAGGGNTYLNCSFNQVGNATAAAQAGTRALTIASVGNTFQDCVIGGDAIVRATGASASVGMLAGAGSSIFKGCTFPMWSSAAGCTHFTAAASTITGYILLDSCQLINDITETGATSLSASIVANGTNLGLFLLTPTTIAVGVTAIATTGPVYFVGVNPGGANSASTGSIAIQAT